MTFEEQVQAEAKELIDKFSFFYPQISEERKLEDVKRCALIAIEAQIEAVDDFAYSDTMWDKRYDDGGRKTGSYADADKFYYYVKQAILNYK